jgi:hypothetical protein
MKTRPLALSLLFLIGLGLFVGTHPCHASARGGALAKPAVSCHGQSHTSGAGERALTRGAPAPQDDPDCCGHGRESRRCGQTCQQVTGIVAHGIPRLTILPAAQLALLPAEWAHLVLAHPIDHVPLA